MNQSLTFEAEPFEISSFELPQRVPPGGGFFKRALTEEEAPDFEFEGAESFETIAPGGGRFDREVEGLEYEAPRGPRRPAVRRCVPVPRILPAPAVTRARAFNTRASRSLLWGNLVDQIEVNIFRCPRAVGRLSPDDFAQATALFQQTQRLKVDGMLGPITWGRMKAIRVERDPFPRAPLNQDFDATANAGLCEMHNHPAIDIGAVAGTPIPAVADGLVIYSGPVGSIQRCAIATGCANGTAVVAACATLSYGRAVIVEHTDRGPGRQPGGQSVYAIYAHVQFTRTRRVVSGERVVAGRLVGEVGADCVGFSTGAHLHYVVASGVRRFRFQGGGPARVQICGTFWPTLTPQRPRSNATAAAFRW